jgi:hypothetical protein
MMAPQQAAFEFLHIESVQGISKAIAFAHAYEDGASSEDFAEYLDILETQLTNAKEAPTD